MQDFQNFRLTTFTHEGLIHPARNGYLWLLERSANAITFVEAKPYVAQDVFTSIDPQTGRLTSRPLPEQSAAMEAILKAQANRSSVGLVEERGPRGGVAVNLRGRFRTPMIARVGNDGKVAVDHFQCPPQVQPGNETPGTETGKEK